MPVPSLREHLIFIMCIAAAALVGWLAPSFRACALIAAGLSYIGVFFHELGHTLFYWLYGYPAVPAFDFSYGGGLTYQFGARSWIFQGAVWLALGLGVRLAWMRGSILAAPLTGFAAAIIVSSLLRVHEDVIVFMGHGAEAAVAAFLLCRGYFNLWLPRLGERWVNVFIGAFMLGSVVALTWALMFDPSFSAVYEVQKGGHRLGDFSRLTDDTGASMRAVGAAFIVYALGCGAALVLWISSHLRAGTAADS